MMFVAVPPPTPIATPAPPPTAAAKAAATPSAESEEASVAVMERFWFWARMSIFEESIWAKTVLATLLTAPIPAPAPLIPTNPPAAAATAAAQAVAEISDRLSAASVILPVVACTPCLVFLIRASILLLMMFSESPTPIATEAPTAPPSAAATAAAPAEDVIVEASVARKVTLPAIMPVAVSPPSIAASISVKILLLIVAPAPPKLTPAAPASSSYHSSGCSSRSCPRQGR